MSPTSVGLILPCWPHKNSIQMFNYHIVYLFVSQLTAICARRQSSVLLHLLTPRSLNLVSRVKTLRPVMHATINAYRCTQRTAQRTGSHSCPSRSVALFAFSRVASFFSNSVETGTTFSIVVVGLHQGNNENK